MDVNGPTEDPTEDEVVLGIMVPALEHEMEQDHPLTSAAREMVRTWPRGLLDEFLEQGAGALAARVQKVMPLSRLVSPRGRDYLGNLFLVLASEVIEANARSTQALLRQIAGKTQKIQGGE